MHSLRQRLHSTTAWPQASVKYPEVVPPAGSECHVKTAHASMMCAGSMHSRHKDSRHCLSHKLQKGLRVNNDAYMSRRD